MNNEQAIKLQNEITRLTSRINALTDRLEEVGDAFEKELCFLPAEGKRLNANGYLIPWSK